MRAALEHALGKKGLGRPRYQRHDLRTAASLDIDKADIARYDDFINKEIRSYRFWDETEDYYDVGTDAIGDHFVRFNSDKPTIKYVT